MSDRKRHEAPRFRVGRLFSNDETPPAGLAPESLDRLERALGTPRAWAAWSWLPAGALAGLLVLGAVTVGRERPAVRTGPPPYQAGPSLSAEEPVAGRTFVADAGREGTVRFDDGSLVTLSPGARATVAAEESRRALVTVVSGRVRFQVRHRSGTAWQVNAGPFRVHVTGTAFVASWSAERSLFELGLEEGSVRVEGGIAGAGLPVVAGQSLLARVDTGEIRVGTAEPVRPPVPVAPPPAVTVLPAPPPARPVRPASSSTATTSVLAPPPQPGEAIDATAGWAALLDSGAYAQVLAEAERMGIERCLEGCSPAAQMALADAARYRGRGDLARRALRALAERHPASREVARAWFLLGQMAEREGSVAVALDAYERCQRGEHPAAYAGLALGRTMTLLRAAGDERGAREAARRYLETSPQGPQSEEARALAGPPP